MDSVVASVRGKYCPPDRWIVPLRRFCQGMWLPLLSFSAALLTGLPVEENQSQPSQALLPSL